MPSGLSSFEGAMRSTRTNSGPDSKGVVRFGRWELEGEAYLFVVAGGILGVLAFAVASSLSLVCRIGLALAPLLLAILWVKTFILGKAPHHLGDRIERCFVGTGFNLDPKYWARLRPPREGRKPPVV